MIKPLLISAFIGAALLYVTLKIVKKRKGKDWEPMNNKEDQTDNIFFT